MKKSILFYSALFFTVSVTAQNRVQSGQTVEGTTNMQQEAKTVKAKSSGSTSASVTSQTDAVSNAGKKGKAELQAKKEMIAAKKEQAENKGAETLEKLQGNEVSANGSASVNANASANQEQVNANSSVNTGTTVSLNKTSSQAIEIKEELITSTTNKTSAGLQKTGETTTGARTQVAGTAHQTGSSAASTTRKTVAAVKAKPVPVSVKSQVNTAAGIKLR